MAVSPGRSPMSAEKSPRLLIRPSMHADEWQKGFFVRVALANGLSPQCPAVMADVCEAARNYSERDHTSLECLRAQPASRLVEPILGGVVPGWALRNGSGRGGLKVCWDCLAEYGYIPVWWKLHGYHLCLRHRKRLDEPARPKGGPLQLERLLQMPAPLSANSGSSATSTPISVDDVAVAEEVWAPAFHAEPIPQPNVLAGALMGAEILRVLVGARRGRDWADKHLQDWQRISPWLRENKMRFHPAAGGIEQFLEALWVPVHRAAAYRVLERVLQQETVNITVVSELPLRRWLALLRSKTVRMFGRGAGGGVPEAARREEVVLIKTLSAELGVHRRKVAWAMHHCRVAPVAILGHNRKFRLIARADVPRIKGHLAEYMSSDEAMEALNLAGRRLVMRLFRIAGLIRAVGAGHSLMCTRASVVGLLQGLRGVAIKRPAVWPSRLVALDDQAIYQRRDARVVRELYADLLAGRIPLFAVEPGEGLRGFALSLDVLGRLARRSLDFASRMPRDARQLELQLC